MNSRPNLFTIVLSLAIFCLAIQSVLGNEPYYKGKPLSDWIFYDSGNASGAPEAIRQMGTNAIPTLLDLLGTTPKTIKRVAARLGSKTMRKHLVEDNDNVVFGQIKESVVEAFGILDTNAELAVPQLVKLLNKNNDDISLYAAAALAQVGLKGFSALTNALSTQTPSIRLSIVIALGQYGGQDPQLVAHILINVLKDPSPDVRHSAGDGLANLKSEEGMPLLMQMLDDKDPMIRQWAALDLKNYGVMAKSAAPKILSLYTNGLDKVFFEALKAIDLDTAGKAESLTFKSGPLNPNRQYHTKTHLKNGLELIVGGWIHTEFSSVTNHYLSSSEIYDPRTGKWTETGEMTTPRYNHSAVLLPSGKVFVVGGESGKYNGTLSSAELYDPTTGKWTPTTSMRSTHYGCKARLNPDGTVLVFTEIYNNVPPPDKIINKCEQYDPATEIWTVVSKPPGR